MFLVMAIPAFLLGSLPFSAWIARSRGVDLRERGSGNVGATNVYRVLGWRAGVLALALDVLKGAAAVALARWAMPHSGGAHALAGVVAVLGHMWSPFLGGRGGKGVATSLGAFLGLAPVPTLWALGLWLGVILFSGWVSLASMAAAVFLPLAVAVAGGGQWVLAIAGALAILVVWRHRSNWARLRTGEESRIWERQEGKNG